MTTPRELAGIEAMYVHARVLHPERFAPDGQPLANYDSRCWHEQPCGDRWADRLASWSRAQEARAQDEAVEAEPAVPDA